MNRHDFSTYDDEALLALYRSGVKEVAEYLLDKYKDMVRKKARAFYLAGGDTDDLIQEGMIGLFKAIGDYREDKAASFSTFAQLCVERQLIKAVQSSNRKKNLPLSDYVPLDNPAGEQFLPSISDPETIILDEEARNTLEEMIESHLSDLEKSVLRLYVEGSSYAEISSRLQLSVKSTDNAVQRIRRKIRNLLTQ